MPTLRDSLLQALQYDAALAMVLPGGVWSATEISRQNTPGAFDANKELKPSALIRWSTESPDGPYTSSSRAYFTIYFYQRFGEDVIQQAMERVFKVLHRQKVGEGVWEVQWADDVRDQQDEALGAALSTSRFVVIRIR